MISKPMREIAECFSPKDLRSFIKIYELLKEGFWELEEFQKFLIKEGILRKGFLITGSTENFLRERRKLLKKLSKEERKRIRTKMLQQTHFGRIKP